MILHEKRLHDPDADTLEWWAVNSNTLVLAHCRVEKGPYFSLDIIRTEEMAAERSFDSEEDPGQASVEILVDCRRHFRKLRKCPAALSLIDRKDLNLPVYLLMGETGGIPTCILHTTDPVFILNYGLNNPEADPKEQLMSFQSRMALPTLGWDHWVTDGRQEFERLLDEYLDQIQNSLKMHDLTKITRR